MPLLITPPEPLLSSAHVPLPTLYAIIDAVHYERKGLSPKFIQAKVGYYYNEAASQGAEPLLLEVLPASFSQEATPEQADGLPIFTFLETLLKARLEAVLPAGTVIETVP